MLPPYIIEQIRRREDDQRRRQYEQPTIDLPLPSSMPFPFPAGPAKKEDDPGGVVIIDL